MVAQYSGLVVRRQVLTLRRNEPGEDVRGKAVELLRKAPPPKGQRGRRIYTNSVIMSPRSDTLIIETDFESLGAMEEAVWDLWASPERMTELEAGFQQWRDLISDEPILTEFWMLR